MAFNIEFTPRQFAYFLFGKKACPRCGGKMRRVRKFEIVDGSIFAKESDPMFFVKNSDVKNYYYVYICDECGGRFKLTELVD